MGKVGGSDGAGAETGRRPGQRRGRAGLWFVRRGAKAGESGDTYTQGLAMGFVPGPISTLPSSSPPHYAPPSPQPTSPLIPFWH